VLSPSSARSGICAWEVSEAIRLGKRVIPVLCRSLGDAKPPRELADRDYIYFYAEPKFPGSGFGPGLLRLAEALNTDLDWHREHTRYLRLATEWLEVGKPPDRRLLSAADIALAKTWAARRPAKAPELTALQREFISASEAEDVRQAAAKAAAEIERREAAGRVAEEAKKAAAARKRTTQVALAGLAVALLAAAAAVWSANETKRQLDRANQALAQSIISDVSNQIPWSGAALPLNALWTLAGSDEAAKADVVGILTTSAGELDRVEGHFAQIFRALGLLRPLHNDVLSPLLTRIGQTDSSTDPRVLRERLESAIQALSAKLTETQMKVVLAPVLQRSGHIEDWGLESLLKVLPVTLTEPQGNEALAAVLKQNRFGWSLAALAPKLTEAQANEAVAPLLKQFDGTYDSTRVAAKAVAALAPKLTVTHANEALAPVLKQIREAHDANELAELASALAALAPKLTEAQANEALAPVLKRVREAELPGPWGGALVALAPKLTMENANEALTSLLNGIDKTRDPVLAEALAALPVKLTTVQASQALHSLLVEIQAPTSSSAPPRLTYQAIHALASQLTDEQAEQALDILLPTTGMDIETVDAQVEAVGALAPKLSEARAKEALRWALGVIGQTDGPFQVAGLARALKVLPVRLTEEQIQQVLDSMLKLIGKHTDPRLREALAVALRVWAPNLTEMQVRQALPSAWSSIAWAATQDEASAWARAVVALLDQPADQDATKELAAAIAYPMAAGPATEVLLEAIRARRSDMPNKDAGTQAALKWLSEEYLEALRRPVCPPPPQPREISRLQCPRG
jgi:hypothetical protein